MTTETITDRLDRGLKQLMDMGRVGTHAYLTYKDYIEFIAENDGSLVFSRLNEITGVVWTVKIEADFEREWSCIRYASISITMQKTGSLVFYI